MKIDCSENMIAAIKEIGIIPLFRSPVKGWSIQDMTAPGCWFEENGSDGVLGPWDWKVDAVNGGGIAYGKFLEGKAAFATAQWYAHLMNWRRSLPKYRMALGERFPARTQSEKLIKYLAPAALDAIKEAGSLGSKELRFICSSALTPYRLSALGAKYKPFLVPAVKKNIMDGVLGFLQMGTWSLVGNIERVYRGPNLAYSGWQIAGNTTPEAIFGEFSHSKDSAPQGWGRYGEAVGDVSAKGGTLTTSRAGAFPELRSGEKMIEMPKDSAPAQNDGAPFWARKFMESADDASPLCVTCSPEQSRETIISHIQSVFPLADRSALEKMI